MTQLVEHPLLVLFTGLPGTLKTYISGRIAHRLGCVWLPTIALGEIDDPNDEGILRDLRITRYARCLDALRILSIMSARVVVDGGFMDTDIQRQVFSTYPKCPKLLIRCVAETESRLARLRMRARSTVDAEQASAESIVNMRACQVTRPTPSTKDTPEGLGCDAIIEIDTTSFDWRVEGMLDADIQERISVAIEHIFHEFRATDKNIERDALKRNFADLASCYEETTEWRTDPTLLAQLRVDLPKRPSDVLDIGSGTGLAAQWYTEQGHHSVGVDLSPQMSVRAASRVLFTTFGSAIDLPFFDASFDLALMRQMLHYTEPTLALQETRRILRNEGQLIMAAAIAPSVGVKPVWEEFKNVTQPLRLRVFAEVDLAKLLHASGFTIVERRHASLTRSESFAQVAQRAREPAGGWADFMKTMERVFAGIAPELEFKVAEDAYSYRQFWVTLVARKAEG